MKLEKLVNSIEVYFPINTGSQKTLISSKNVLPSFFVPKKFDVSIFNVYVVNRS